MRQEPIWTPIRSPIRTPIRSLIKSIGPRFGPQFVSQFGPQFGPQIRPQFSPQSVLREPYAACKDPICVFGCALGAGSTGPSERSSNPMEFQISKSHLFRRQIIFKCGPNIFWRDPFSSTGKWRLSQIKQNDAQQTFRRRAHFVQYLFCNSCILCFHVQGWLTE